MSGLTCQMGIGENIFSGEKYKIWKKTQPLQNKRFDVFRAQAGSDVFVENFPLGFVEHFR